MSVLGRFLRTHVSVYPYAKGAGRISEGRLRALRRGLTSTYQGCAVDAFLEYLTRNNEASCMPEKQRYYGKFCSIVQSSGTKKTRLMLEASFHRCA